MKRLKEHDPDLGARWHRDKERWIVTWRGKDALVVQNTDGSYRPLDERMVTKARLADAWQHRSGREFMRVLNEENHRLTESEQEHVRDEFSQAMKEEGHRAVFGSRYFQGHRVEDRTEKHA